MALTCDNMTGRPICDQPVTHLDHKGFAYCTPCGTARKASGRRCRKLRAWELKKLTRGEALARY